MRARLLQEAGNMVNNLLHMLHLSSYDLFFIHRSPRYAENNSLVL